MITKYHIIFAIILLVGITACENTENPQVQVQPEDFPIVQFQNFDEKISYCIGLDHALGAKQIYGSKQYKDVFTLSDINEGMVDYLSDAELRIPIQEVDKKLDLYLLPGGQVDKNAVPTADASYCIGITEGQYLVDNLVGRGIDQIVYVDFLVMGINHGYQGGKTIVSPTEARSEISNYYADLNKEQGEYFLEQNKLNDSIQVTETGLQYKIIEQGYGKQPNLTDSVVVHYTGMFLDGRVFDTSIPSQIPGRFTPLELIPGWQEALLMMKEGGQWRIFVPYQLAYGPDGSGPVEPYSVLIFDIELLKVKRYTP